MGYVRSGYWHGNGLLNARKVAKTMSKKITSLNHGQGFTANLVTGALVIFASRLGMPVSTTHDILAIASIAIPYTEEDVVKSYSLFDG